MDAAGEGSSRKARNKQDGGKRPARKRKPRTQRAASVTQLIQQLRETVFPEGDTQATRKEVLQQAKQYILQLEQTLDSLLKMKGDIITEGGGSCSLEDIKEEYLQLIGSGQRGQNNVTMEESEVDPVLLYLNPEVQKDLEEAVEELKIENSTERSSPGVLEFERYLDFYRQTVDMLVENRVVSPGQVTHPIVSRAISSLWQELRQDGRTSIYQKCLIQARNTAVCTSGGKPDSGAESQEATSSFLSSTPEDILLDDALDVASEFLDCGVNQTFSGQGSPPLESSPLGNGEGDDQLYLHISQFLRAKFSSRPEVPDPPCDYESVLLRCTETFDDEDDL
ncbi:stimulated by retinoic acid gene 8 protein homolog [Engystomops pustulosus]|uniref:stimulated by retinoic acid gene 8 protein homolog n=1 Tax=Engystomops pustulosus TaxID=76066 RepID=UPI003AFAD87B